MHEKEMMCSFAVEGDISDAKVKIARIYSAAY